MKNLTIKLLLIFYYIIVFGTQCDPPNNANPNYIKLSGSFNNTSETIYLGDTLKFTLSIPDVVQTVNINDGTIANIKILNLQSADYLVVLNQIDTLTKTVNRLWNIKYMFPTVGGSNGYGEFYTTTNSTPYTSTINILPTSKGIYSIETTSSIGKLQANNAFIGYLRVNFGNVDKHLAMYNFYLGNNGWTTVQIDSLNKAGYGVYFFKVD